jgi:hypothetical protein
MVKYIKRRIRKALLSGVYRRLTKLERLFKTTSYNTVGGK